MPRLLDLFCGAGGASVGYARAGFEVVGVDSAPQPHYPFVFHQMDAMNVSEQWLLEFDCIHASPPCQDHSSLHHRVGRHGTGDLLLITYETLIQTGVPWVIENVVGAELPATPITLCGSQFGLKVRRHRRFWSSEVLFQHECRHKEQGTPVGCYGHGGGKSTRGTKGTAAQCREAMGIDWMNRDEMAQAIPPAYTEFIGRQLIGDR